MVTRGRCCPSDFDVYQPHFFPFCRSCLDYIYIYEPHILYSDVNGIMSIPIIKKKKKSRINIEKEGAKLKKWFLNEGIKFATHLNIKGSRRLSRTPRLRPPISLSLPPTYLARDKSRIPSVPWPYKNPPRVRETMIKYLPLIFLRRLLSDYRQSHSLQTLLSSNLIAAPPLSLSLSLSNFFLIVQFLSNHRL